MAHPCVESVGGAALPTDGPENNMSPSGSRRDSPWATKHPHSMRSTSPCSSGTRPRRGVLPRRRVRMWFRDPQEGRAVARFRSHLGSFLEEPAWVPQPPLISQVADPQVVQAGRAGKGVLRKVFCRVGEAELRWRNPPSPRALHRWVAPTTGGKPAFSTGSHDCPDINHLNVDGWESPSLSIAIFRQEILSFPQVFCQPTRYLT